MPGGFARFGIALETPGMTDDPVADWVTQGWAYRRFALDNPHLYRVMFGDGLVALHTDDPASMETFFSLLRRIQRCVDEGRLVVGDVHLAGEAVWASVHGHMMIELTGYFESMDRDARRAFAEGMRLLALGYGDQPRHSTLRCGPPGAGRATSGLRSCHGAASRAKGDPSGTSLSRCSARRSARAGTTGVAAAAIARAAVS